MGVDPHEHTPSPSAPEGGPSSRGAIAAFLAVAAVVVAAAIAVAVAPTPAGATGLVPFADCPALAAYGAAGSAVPLGGSVGAAEDLASGAPTTVVPSWIAMGSASPPA